MELILNIKKYAEDGRQKHLKPLAKIKITMEGYAYSGISLETYNSFIENILNIGLTVIYKRKYAFAVCSPITTQGLKVAEMFLMNYKMPLEMPDSLELLCIKSEIEDVIKFPLGDDKLNTKPIPYLRPDMFWDNVEHMFTIGGSDGLILDYFADIINPTGFYILVGVKNKNLLKILPDELYCISKEHGAIALYLPSFDVHKLGLLKRMLLENIEKYPVSSIEKDRFFNYCSFLKFKSCLGWHKSMAEFKGVCGACIY